MSKPSNALLLHLFAVICGLSCIFGANILGVFPVFGKSHYLMDIALMKGLVEKGHNVTVICNFKSEFTMPNYHHIHLDVAVEKEYHAQFDTMMKEPNKIVDKFFQFPQAYMKYFHRAVAVQKHETFQQFLKSDQKFDLLVLEWLFNDFQLGIGGHYRCPIVIITTQPALKPLRDWTGTPAAFASTAIYRNDATNKIHTFTERLYKFVVVNILESLFIYAKYAYHAPTYDQFFPAHENYPTFDEVKKNVSLVLVNDHFSQGGSRPYATNMVEISGIQIKNTPDPLPKEIDTFLNDTDEHGAILFSFGTNMKSCYMPSELLSAILNVFGRLKQKIIFKWEADTIPSNKPDNVFMTKWLPQEDILAHPNLRLFISHCGLGSVNEARFHGKPILCIPIFGDQPMNADRVFQEGWSIKLSYTNITETSFMSTVNEMLTNLKYAEVVKHFSVLYRDRPQIVLDTAVYWVEYVLKHKGARHMQSSTIYLNFFQENSLDVIAFLILSLIIIYVLLKWFVVLGTKWLKRRSLVRFLDDWLAKTKKRN